jgi:DNA-binding response OmpR family regulator
MDTPEERSALSIAVVEDHETLRELVCQRLNAYGYQVCGFASAEELLVQGGDKSVDIFLLDLNLPGEDGLSLSRQLRTRYPLAGIIMLSARSAIHERVAGYECGADLYLSKPFDIEELLAAIGGLARRQEIQRHLAVVVHSSTFTLDSLTLSLNGPGAGQPTYLTASEVKIMQAFAQAPHQRLAVGQILELLALDPASYPKSSLEVRVARLRKKLIQAGGHANCLESVRREGYQLCLSVVVI